MRVPGGTWSAIGSASCPRRGADSPCALRDRLRRTTAFSACATGNAAITPALIKRPELKARSSKPGPTSMRACRASGMMASPYQRASWLPPRSKAHTRTRRTAVVSSRLESTGRTSPLRHRRRRRMGIADDTSSSTTAASTPALMSKNECRETRAWPATPSRDGWRKSGRRCEICIQ